MRSAAEAHQAASSLLRASEHANFSRLFLDDDTSQPWECTKLLSSPSYEAAITKAYAAFGRPSTWTKTGKVLAIPRLRVIIKGERRQREEVFI
jgi:hypothetical protein